MTSNSKVAEKKTKPKRRGWKIASGVIATVVIGWFVFASLSIVNPAQGNLSAQSDVVVSLAPQQDRLPMAQGLVEDGVADTLLISYFDHDPMNHTAGVTPLSTHCESEGDSSVRCFTPQEDATIGEARAIADIAREESWQSLTIVTNSFHRFRTNFIFDQCLGDEFDINVVYTDQTLNASQLAWHVVYENVAFFKAAWQTATRC